MQKKASLVPLLSAGTLFLWSAVFIAFHVTGRINFFVTPSFRPGALAAGIVLGILGVLLLLLRDKQSSEDCCDTGCCGTEPHAPHDHPANQHTNAHAHDCGDDACGHAHAEEGRGLTVGQAAFFGSLSIPLLIAAFFAPTGFSAQAVANRMASTSAYGQPPPDLALAGMDGGPIAASPMEELPLPTLDGEPEVFSENEPAIEAEDIYILRDSHGRMIAEVVDPWYATTDPPFREAMEKERVVMFGQYYPRQGKVESAIPGNRPAEGQAPTFELLRLFMSCCAADAQPVSVVVEADDLPATEPMSWLRIEGRVRFHSEGGKLLPTIVADVVEAIDPPNESYLF